jgi:alpha-tubulin suppressor-like RCC1 family protein
MNLPGMTATGIVTASSLKGVTTGSATGLTGNPDLDVGIVTASSFVGQGDGHAANLTGTPNLNVGLITATSFVGFVTGDVTGNITGDVTGNITGNIQGDVEGNVTGNVSGLARGLGINGLNVWTGAGTSNLGVGVCTAIQYHGDGSTLTGAGSSAYIVQNVNATSGSTTIDLSYGNVIYYTSSSNTTIAFSNPSAAEQITFIRNTGNSYTITWPATVKWNDGTTPTLVSNARDAAFQIFRFTTFDTGSSYNAWEEMQNDSETFGLYGAGSTGYGALGTNYAPDPATYFSSPVQIPGTSWSSLSEQTFTGAASGAIKSDGTFWVWGKTNGGILGLNEAGAGLSDSKSSPIQLGTETTWDNVSFGGNDSAGCMAIKTDNTLWSWGQNEKGTLGHNSNVDYSSPVQVSGTTWKWVNYAGEDYILAVKTDGTLWRWGGNPIGAGGDNLPGTSPARRSSPVQIGTDTSWAYAGGNRNGHSIATKTDGTLWCWGDNSRGALGQNSITSPSYSGISSPTQVGSGTDWSYDNSEKIVAAYQRCFAIKTNGTLWGWGRSHQGQLGQNEGGYKDYSSPVQIPGTNWSTISCVSEVIATKTDGTLWTWGDNGEGKGMLNSDVDRSSPTQVPGTWNSGQRGISGGSPFFALKVE